MKVKCTVKINSKDSLSELPDAWSVLDYKNILDLMGFTDEVADDEIKEMAMMAIADNEPEESAEILLQYRLGEKLSEGQIKQLAHEMQDDKVSEEYPDIFLQHEFFNINQLLFKSFNGRFPNCHATSIDMDLKVNSNEPTEMDRMDEMIIKSLLPALGESSVIARLYEDDMKSEQELKDASGIIWKKNIQDQGEGNYKIQFFSSEYWLHDLPSSTDDFEVSFGIFKEDEEHV